MYSGFISVKNTRAYVKRKANLSGHFWMLIGIRKYAIGEQDGKTTGCSTQVLATVMVVEIYHTK